MTKFRKNTRRKRKKTKKVDAKLKKTTQELTEATNKVTAAQQLVALNETELNSCKEKLTKFTNDFESLRLEKNRLENNKKLLDAELIQVREACEAAQAKVLELTRLNTTLKKMIFRI